MLSLTTTCRFQHRLKSSPNQSKHDHLVLDNQKNDTIATSNDAQKLFITLPKRQNCYKKPKPIALSLSHFQISISHSHSLSLSLSLFSQKWRSGRVRSVRLRKITRRSTRNGSTLPIQVYSSTQPSFH